MNDHVVDGSMATWGSTGSDYIVFGSTNATLGTFVTPDHLCPDLLRYEQIGPADNWRGRVVRAFFFLMRAWHA